MTGHNEFLFCWECNKELDPKDVTDGELHVGCWHTAEWIETNSNKDVAIQWAKDGPGLLDALKDARQAIQQTKDDNGDDVLGIAVDTLGIIWPIVDELLCKMDEAIRAAEAIGGGK